MLRAYFPSWLASLFLLFMRTTSPPSQALAQQSVPPFLDFMTRAHLPANGEGIGDFLFFPPP